MENKPIKKVKKLTYPQDFFNIKCILFSVYIALLYWFLPRTKLTLTLITILNYGIVNWYNHMYVCKVNHFMTTAIYVLITTALLAYLPLKNKVVLAFSIYFPYFIMAWYDYFANCSFRMNPTIFPFGRFIYLPMKPDPYKRRYDELDPIVKQNIANFDKYMVVSITSFAVIYGIIKYVV